MRIYRCPRCRAEDIAADAHPTRILDNGIERVIFVCRNCYRAAELEFRIASQAADLGYVPLERATAHDGPNGPGYTMPCRSAKATAAVREERPSLVRTLATCR